MPKIGTKVWGPGPTVRSRTLFAVPGDIVTAEVLAAWQDDDAFTFETEAAEPDAVNAPAAPVGVSGFVDAPVIVEAEPDEIPADVDDEPVAGEPQAEPEPVADTGARRRRSSR